MSDRDFGSELYSSKYIRQQKEKLFGNDKTSNLLNSELFKLYYDSRCFKPSIYQEVKLKLFINNTRLIQECLDIILSSKNINSYFNNFRIDELFDIGSIILMELIIQFMNCMPRYENYEDFTDELIKNNICKAMHDYCIEKINNHQ